jgi:hypothetical protein
VISKICVAGIDRERNDSFAGLALAGIGVFGPISFAVASRTNAISIGMTPGAAGVPAGTAASPGASRLLAGMLFGAKPAAPHVLLAAAECLVAAMIAATLIAARRATCVDPAISLRHEQRSYFFTSTSRNVLPAMARFSTAKPAALPSRT